MNPLHETDLARQRARAWSGRLGSLAGTSPAVGPEAASLQPDTLSSALPTRLSAILNQLRQRHQRQEHGADKLRAQEFVMGP
jgi:hypothetical protein